MYTLQLFLLVIGSYFLFYGIFWFFLTSISSRHKVVYPAYINEDNPEVLIVLPAYRPGPIFLKVMDNVSKVIKGRGIHVYVLLQNADHIYSEAAKKLGFYTEVKMFDHLGGNSYQHALRHVAKVILRERQTGRWSPEFVMLLDKDNLIGKDFFNNIPSSIYDSFDVIQGKRTPLNTNNAVSFFDGMSESLNDAMFRSAKEKIGGMIEISGSGALIEADLFVDTINHLDPNAPGFDKNFMIQMLTCKRDVRSTFWAASELSEEKTDTIDAHNPQRVRWFGEQYYNALVHGKMLFRAFRHFRRFAALDYLITLWRPPRSVQLFFTVMLAVAEIGWRIYSGSWIAIVPIFTVSLILLGITISTFLFSKGVFLKAIRHSTRIPMLAMSNLFNAARSIQKENRGKFIHTSHRF